MMTRVKLASALSLLPILLLSVFSVSAQIVEKEKTTIRLLVHVFDLDVNNRNAAIKMHVTVDRFPFNVSEVIVGITGGGDLKVLCHNSLGARDGTWMFKGETNQTDWLLEGKAENFPFDSYRLIFRVSDISLQGDNFTLSQGDALFTGAKSTSLKEQWEQFDSLPRLYDWANNKVEFIVGRTLSTRLMAFLNLILPILLCFFLLGATHLSDPEKDIGNRLTINLSLFIFSSTFMIHLQNFIPQRSGLSFPELLVSILVSSNAIFAIFSLVGKYLASTSWWKERRDRMTRWDLYASLVCYVIIIILYLSTLYGKLSAINSLILGYVPTIALYYGHALKLKRLPKADRPRLPSLLFAVMLLLPLVILLSLHLFVFFRFGFWIPLF